MNRILVIESETVLLDLLADILNINGFYTITTTSFECGYELIEQEKPDLILCGCSSNNMSGYGTCWTFLQKIRQDVETGNIPLILMTGDDLETIPNWQNYLTYHNFLFKPFTSQVLQEKIHTHLQWNKYKSILQSSLFSSVYLLLKLRILSSTSVLN